MRGLYVRSICPPPGFVDGGAAATVSRVRTTGSGAFGGAVRLGGCFCLVALDAVAELEACRTQDRHSLDKASERDGRMKGCNDWNAGGRGMSARQARSAVQQVIVVSKLVLHAPGLVEYNMESDAATRYTDPQVGTKGHWRRRHCDETRKSSQSYTTRPTAR